MDEIRAEFPMRIMLCKNVTNETVQVFVDGMERRGMGHNVDKLFGFLIGVVEGREPHPLESVWLGGEYSEDDKRALAWSFVSEHVDNASEEMMLDAYLIPQLSDLELLEIPQGEDI